jgi:hypothetical protein
LIGQIKVKYLAVGAAALQNAFSSISALFLWKIIPFVNLARELKELGPQTLID